MSEILTVTELAALLKVSKRHIHELTKDRTRTGEMRRHPLPVLRIGTVSGSAKLTSKLGCRGLRRVRPREARSGS
jgi:plasmid maintenance system antidote protein VapI